MSAPQESAIQRTYPLSPSPNSELRKTVQPLTFGAPRTPQSPLQIGTAASAIAPRSDTMNAVAQDGSSLAGATTTSPIAVDFNGSGDDSALKRKYEGPENGEHKDKKVHVEERKPSISDLHIDVGKIYQLCRTPHPPTQPDLSLDLFELYGLNSVAAKVARVLPDGTKNGLRKTYKGKIKELGISGKFDVKVHDEDAPSGLMAMMREPELEWNVSQVHGREMSQGLSSIKNLLPKALSMNKGIIPKQMWDSSVLGELDQGEKKKEGLSLPAAPYKPGSAIGMQRTSSSQSMGYRPPQPKEMARPKRAVKKRGYDESSFEGYGEGFVDDDMADGGYSTGDAEDGRKRRKKSAPTQNVYANSRYSSYGPGSVGS